MPIVTIQMKTKTSRYDLANPADVTKFKGLISRCIKSKDLERLKGVVPQLEKIEDNDVATEQLGKLYKLLANENLITDVRFFPRCEYYTRFAGTTVFDMDNPIYWGTYHRSESSRFFKKAGGRSATQFISPCVKKTEKANSFSAHTGCFHSPFSLTEYSNAFGFEKQIPEGNKNIRDQLLHYKRRMAEVVVQSFEAHSGQNQQQFQKGRSKASIFTRPIVYVENDYPCVLVAFPALNPKATPTEAAKYWQKHPKPFQNLLLSSLIAFVNVEAMWANIPIEMVLRASFGHNLPSVCETDHTFRINTGVIPHGYAVLIGKALHQLNEAVNRITDEASAKVAFDDQFLAKVNVYNARKLKKAIKGKPRYASLEGTPNYDDAAQDDGAFEGLYKSFCDANNEQSDKPKSNFIPVNLQDKTIWEVIRCAGDSMGKSVLDECFRQKGTADWFADQVMEALLANSANPIEIALDALLQCLVFSDTVTMDYEKIDDDLSKPRRIFANMSFESIYAQDPDFTKIVNMLFEGFCAERPNRMLYSELERAGTNFFITARGREAVQAKPDYGSDSDFEDDLTNAETQKKMHIAHRKLRVCSGMKAIVLAQYGALSYLREKGCASYNVETEQMYYEVEDALQYVNADWMTRKHDKPPKQSKILHFDLNHCNASNSANNPALEAKLQSYDPVIVILDYTSATVTVIKEALRQCFARRNITFVLLVESGLKHDQGGHDINPYGEVRVCARSRVVAEKVFNLMKAGLSEEDKLTPKAHEKVRACKQSGFAPSLLGLFKTDQSRFAPVDDARDQPLVP